MTYDPDPRMRDVDPRYDSRNTSAESTPPWGWIAGAIFVFLVLAVIFSYGGNAPMTATKDTVPPPSTTGTAPPPNPRPAAPTVPLTPPAPPTGQGTAQ